MSDTERRTAKRITHFVEAELEGIDVSRRIQLRLADLSANGAFVDARTVLPTGTTARLTFTLLEREISVLVEVRYSLPTFGMGVRFLDLGPEDVAVIDEFTRQQG